MPAQLVTVAQVDLCDVGTWNLSTGPTTFTSDDFAHAVEALDCPAIRTPVIKIGHMDKSWLGDGQPSIGRLTNVGVSASGQTLIGDYTGVPAWLGGILASAWPQRSIEGMWNYRCALDHVHPFVLTGVALLGVCPPGVETLDDLPDGLAGVAALFGVDDATDIDVAASAIDDNGSGSPVSVIIDAQEAPVPRPTEAATAAPKGIANSIKCVTCNHKGSLHNDRKDTGPNTGACAAPNCSCSMMVAPAPSTANAALAVEDVRRGFYDNLGPSQQWWWIRAIYINPPELIVDDDNDNLYRVGYTITAGTDDDEDDLVFADPVPVEIQYVDMPAVAASSARPTAPWMAYASADASRSVAASDPDPTNGLPGQEGATVNIAELRKSLGLAEDVTDEEVIAAAVERLNTPPAPAPAPVADPVVPATAVAEPAAPRTLPEGLTMIDEETLRDLQTAAASGREAKDRQRRDDRDRYIDSAIQAGKFGRGRRDYWLGYYDRDEAGAREYIDSVAAGAAVPLTEVGHPGTGENSGPDDMDREFAELARLGSTTAAEVIAKTHANRPSQGA